MTKMILLLLAFAFHDVLAMALVYSAKGILWLTLQISALAEVL